MCIASNGVPPTISKRIIVNVHCKIYTTVFFRNYTYYVESQKQNFNINRL